MDWYLLEHKCVDRLRLALKVRKVRNEYVEQVIYFLRNGGGVVSGKHLISFPGKHFNDQKAFENLIGPCGNHSEKSLCDVGGKI